MSGYTADILAHQGVLDEGVNFIEKPFSLTALAEKVREVLDKPSRKLPFNELNPNELIGYKGVPISFSPGYEHEGAILGYTRVLAATNDSQ